VLVVVLTGFTVGVNVRVGQATLPIVHPTVTGVFTVIFDQVIKATCKMTFVAAIPNTRKKIIATNSEQIVIRRFEFSSGHEYHVDPTNELLIYWKINIFGLFLTDSLKHIALRLLKMNFTWILDVSKVDGKSEGTGLWHDHLPPWWNVSNFSRV
jgi:hypothetical protein